MFLHVPYFEQKGLRRPPCGWYPSTRTAVDKPNPTQIKLVGQTSRSSHAGTKKKTQPLLTIMLKIFKLDDSGASSEHRMAAGV